MTVRPRLHPVAATLADISHTRIRWKGSSPMPGIDSAPGGCAKSPFRRWAGWLLVLTLPASAGAALRFEEGVARNPDSPAVLYRERHWIRIEGDRPVERLVLYLCPDGTAFGRKQVDYRRSAAAPAFRFDDFRSGYAEGLRDARSPEVFFRPGGGASEKSAPLASRQLVVDAGFDEFIRSQWRPLVAGDAVPLDFALPARLESMAFTIRRVGESRVDGEPAWIFRLRLGGVIGWLAPHIDVSYGQQSRRLLRFEGLSNVRDDAGDKQVTARIDFPQPSRSADDGEWAAAMKTRLAACAIGQ